MVVPLGSNFPDEFDTDLNLFQVYDGMRLRLAEDYNPGDTSVVVEGDLLILSRFPPTGLITLTEQCSDVDERAISFHYTGVDFETGVISGLELLDGFPDVIKPKKITNVTMNVMAEHHNNMKDALIAIQEFAGVEGTKDDAPFGPTLEGRINFLRELVLQPKAWFTSDIRTGIVPLTVEFREMAFRLGTDGTAGPVEITWDFGDQTASTISLASVISATDMVPGDAVDVIVRDEDGGKIKKIYHTPGIYTVKMTVKNDFGEDEAVFEDYISARSKAPDEAVIRFVENTETQEASPGVPPNGPFETVPTIRSPINTLIEINIPDGPNPATPNRSWSGELLDSSDQPIDKITSWTWAIGDDLNHASSPNTKASFSVGGIYDLKIRVDTELGAYRITTYEDAIDIIENQNLWLFTYQNSTSVRSYEYGLISESFKLTSAPTYVVNRNDAFLDGKPEEGKQKEEFRKNTSFAKVGSSGSGLGATALLFWAGGRGASELISTEKIRSVEFSGFLGTYVTRSEIPRAWNWLSFNGANSTFFFGGTTSDSPLPNTSPVNTDVLEVDLLTLSTTVTELLGQNYLNGAQELENNVAIYDGTGESTFGHFSVYRTSFKDNSGYFARNDGVGPFFRIKSFYMTEGTTSNPVINIRKMQDIQGPTKLEGRMTDLSQGIYFFNNTGSISSFNDFTTTWATGGPGLNSILYRSLQDTSTIGFDSPANTLLLASDGDKRAYLSYDYSENVFLKFQEIDTTFVTLGQRPSGEQWMMGVY